MLVPRQSAKFPLGTDVWAGTEQHVQTESVSRLNVSSAQQQHRYHIQTTDTAAAADNYKDDDNHNDDEWLTCPEMTESLLKHDKKTVEESSAKRGEPSDDCRM